MATIYPGGIRHMCYYYDGRFPHHPHVLYYVAEGVGWVGFGEWQAGDVV
jgi:hypothetical protein